MKYTIQSGRTSPRKSTGRPPKLLTEQVDELEAYVRSSSNTRQMSYLELAMKFPQWNVGEEAVKNSLQQRGYGRYVARNKPPLSPENKRLRLEWAYRHINFSIDDWCKVIWSDETYISDGPVNKVYVTIKVRLDAFDV